MWEIAHMKLNIAGNSFMLIKYDKKVCRYSHGNVHIYWCGKESKIQKSQLSSSHGHVFQSRLQSKYKLPIQVPQNTTRFTTIRCSLKGDKVRGAFSTLESAVDALLYIFGRSGATDDAAQKQMVSSLKAPVASGSAAIAFKPHTDLAPEKLTTECTPL